MKLLLLSLAFVLFSSCGHAQDSAPSASAQASAAIATPPPAEATAGLTVANEIRQQNNLPLFRANPILTAVAQGQAEDMLRRNYFAHSTPEGLSPFDRMDKAGLRYGAAAENIAMGETDPHAVFQMWLFSPGHKKNLLNKIYLRQGIGYAGGYWVHDFAD
jgi:uncharacterized protein YkwD